MIPERSIIKTTLVSLLKEKVSMKTYDVYEEIAVRLSLTKPDLELKHTDGKSKFKYEVRWSKKDLVESGVIEEHEVSGRGIWQLTDTANMMNSPTAYADDITVSKRDTGSEIAQAIEAIASITGKPRKSSGQRFQNRPEVRRAIELQAMSLAIDYFQNQGWIVEDVSQRESYDLRCTRQQEELYVEVKGTTSEGSQILLTPNEVLHTQQNYPNTALFVVSQLQVNNSGEEAEVTGGKIQLFMPWLLKDDDLKAIGYECRVPRT
jgi:hypothetical protein